ncbi:uncharacterized protein LOC109823444 [Asparagus officinalis]|uniref:uncharacterized protein LOC109823444 n=1 Tax=Asparagus officinalis TaxID=4686 RepID=UPI00098E5444|nr:uncharacterized protein LOC109823444 [Asparagus officinalis]
MEHDYIADRSWMYKEENERFEEFFIAGVDCFIEFALQHSVEGRSNVCCPCKKCQNHCSYDTKTIKMHIVKNGFVHGYTKWYFHGENRKRLREETINMLPSRDDIARMLASICPSSSTYENDVTSDSSNRTGRDRNVRNFENLIEDAKKPLYPNCQKYSKLSFIVRLFQIKCLNKWSNKSLSSLLELLKDLLPEDNLVPKTWYEAKKVMDEMGLKCNKIHACCNDCVLFRGEYENLNSCPVCKESRWKQRREDSRGKNVPIKILRHFPLIPRLQRLYMSKKTAVDMTWHHNAPREDGKMSHPRDSEAWRDFDAKHPSFGMEPRNVRLGLASNGFSPFKLMTGGNRSTWPVILIAYNLPPWFAMKQSFFMLSLLIDGPKSPGNDIDVYLQPLIDELNTLWEDGIDTYDAANDETFKLRAAILWTINDFPAYGMLSGWSTKGYTACPICHTNHGSIYLPCSRKCVYLRHRRFLSTNHTWRNDRKSFNGEVEKDTAPISLSGHDVLNQWQNYNNVAFGRKKPTPKGQVQIRESKIIGLKSHDYHVLMQQLLPLAMRTSLRNDVGLVLNDYCSFFRELCSKVIDVHLIEKLEQSIPIILCKLEVFSL